ncbi:hypothetical protein DMA15_03735 [Streptomyces sp. WAC 01529]|uniref:hypothetical protein n=1 Tax=Streptomyces sp. WAC 01529 TaxID=2203205 RepID=UPI000F6B6DD3|nr:hypothetical protein [Streptomyces sp. WAC 01529]AZM51805.1 hypothetical protein DMA15_03735 [Streptomyces sp. WAC 01529]
MNTQVKRKRRLPVAPPEPARADWRRAYCPGCGEVQRNYGPWRALHVGLVTPHLRAVVPDTAPRSRWAEKTTEVRCGGGPVDLIADRAP